MVQEDAVDDQTHIANRVVDLYKMVGVLPTMFQMKRLMNFPDDHEDRNVEVVLSKMALLRIPNEEYEIDVIVVVVGCWCRCG